MSFKSAMVASSITRGTYDPSKDIKNRTVSESSEGDEDNVFAEKKPNSTFDALEVKSVPLKSMHFPTL